MTSKKVFILNDTRSELHHGCSRVMNNIHHLIKINNGVLIGSSPVGFDWRICEDTKSKILSADIVIVNGEGSIHHDSKAGIPLLYVGSFCKQYNIKSILVNALYQSMTVPDKTLLKDFDHISVRDSFSQKELHDDGLDSVLLQDLSLYSESLNYNERNGKNIVTCSVSLEKTRDLIAYTKSSKSLVFEPVIYGKGKWAENVGKSNLFHKMKEMGPRKFIDKCLERIHSKFKVNESQLFSKIKTHDQYHDSIAKSESLISGRFHSVCFAINSYTPFVALSSNSHKLEALINDFGLSENRIFHSVKQLQSINVPDFSENELESIQTKLDFYRSETKKFFEMIFS